MEIEGVTRVDLPTLFVVGKEGRGLAEEGPSWVPLLWDQMNTHFDEVVELLAGQEMKDLQLWGLMSDGEQWLEPWQKRDAIWQGSKYQKRQKRLKDGYAGNCRQ